jgi:predicted TIM-barrel fold metal-dependent hydrolase
MRDLRDGYLKLGIGEKVSGYIIRQAKARRIFVGCEGGEPLLAAAVKLIGNEPFMYSTDFPHEVNAETCKKDLVELTDNDALSAEDKDSILYRNAEDFYGFKNG